MYKGTENHYSFGTQIQLHICVHKCRMKRKNKTNLRKSGTEYQVEDYAA